MALLTGDTQGKILKLLIDEGLVSSDVINKAKEDSKKNNRPLLEALSEQAVVDEELLTHAIAFVSGVSYVNLTTSLIDQDILNLGLVPVADPELGITDGSFNIPMTWNSNANVYFHQL